MASGQETSSHVEEVMKKKLFESAMKVDWEEVKNIYKHHRELHQEMITKSGDTALHVAVLYGEEDNVEQLVEIIKTSVEASAKTPRERNEQIAETLGVRNERGDTPLHLAAAVGSERICKCIAEKDPELIGARNCDQETPLSVAVLNGNKDAFLCLQKFSKDEGYSYCRGKYGDTILHSAINVGNFDLAFEIIKHYAGLVQSVNHIGLTPLHVLASKPSAFKSGSRLPWYSKIIYTCTIVGEPEVQLPDEGGEVPNYPANYQTCIDFFGLLRRMFRAHFIKRSNSVDAENQALWVHHQMLPPIYDTCFEVVKLALKTMLIILRFVFKIPFMAMLIILARFGFREITRVQKKKAKHQCSLLLLKKLLDVYSTSKYQDDGQKPPGHEVDMGDAPMDPSEANKDAAIHYKETPILMATKNGIIEMVEEILKRFPVAMHDVNSDNKNVVLLAVENRRPHVFKLLLDESKKSKKEFILRKVDKDGNSALHLAARFRNYDPWDIPGAALQMQWEIKWYEFVKNSIPRHFFPRYNNKGETPNGILRARHEELAEARGKWLTETSDSCSVVAALIATVAFATSSTVPGGVDGTNGKPILENELAFEIFAISSVVALCFSVTSLVMFLSIHTSRRRQKDLGTDLPRKLLWGLTSLFVSIASVLVSFCAGHFFVLRDKLKYATIPVYAVTCLPVMFFAKAVFPLYWDLFKATFLPVPRPLN